MLHYFTDSLDFLAVPRTVVIMYNIGFDISRAYYNLNRRYLDHHAFIITIKWQKALVLKLVKNVIGYERLLMVAIGGGLLQGLPLPEM